MQKSIKSGEQWLDTEGVFIQAHGGGILYHEGVYYWYGENKDYPQNFREKRINVIGISCYSSTDLCNWKNEGLVLSAVPDDPDHDLHPSKVLERPKVEYNEKTGKFVMWMHIDAHRYRYAAAGVAVADSPTGPFTYIESVNPEGQDSRDQTLFKDDDGKAYRIYSSEDNMTTYISLLSDDYLKHTGEYARAFENRMMEAQAVCKRGGKYYMFASGCSGWAPNTARCAVADSIMGPWKELGNPCLGEGMERTFESQSAFILPVAGQSDAFIFMADRWNPKNLGDSRYIWLPIEFHERRIAAGPGFREYDPDPDDPRAETLVVPEIRWRDEWDLSFFA
ncbi:family 43 glycosylhydrolase [Candidatus Sumerlaeota bacterium]|nr:family 43 glycosylhydrolase [Candidatus Sumerlaeota bacterium]